MDRGFSDLGNKMDQMLDKQDATIRAIQGLDSKMDQMLDKQDLLVDKQDETTGGDPGTADRSEGPHRHEVSEDRDGDLAEVKTALKEKGII